MTIPASANQPAVPDLPIQPLQDDGATSQAATQLDQLDDPAQIPAPAKLTAIDLVFPCSCGNTFRITPEFAGKQIPCPLGTGYRQHQSFR